VSVWVEATVPPAVRVTVATENTIVTFALTPEEADAMAMDLVTASTEARRLLEKGERR
jgi:hypothetical protein